MKRISTLTDQQIIDYNLRDGGTAYAVFEDTQPDRVRRARGHIDTILARPDVVDLGPMMIVELGCGAGDITGPFSDRHIVMGFDITPAAVRVARERYPRMTVVESRVETLAPTACDILVMTEFLEHVPDPGELVDRWFPKAKYVVVGHPLNDPGDREIGHLWSYDLRDFRGWFLRGGHVLLEHEVFSEGFPEMVLGHGIRGRWPGDAL